jgi:hypothetical protein
MTRKTLKSKIVHTCKQKQARNQSNDPKGSYEAVKLIWEVKNSKTQIQKFHQKSSQAGNITQCENH